MEIHKIDFGMKRGGVAHTAKIHITEIRSSVTTDVDTTLDGLKSYDGAIEMALKRL